MHPNHGHVTSMQRIGQALERVPSLLPCEPQQSVDLTSSTRHICWYIPCVNDDYNPIPRTKSQQYGAESVLRGKAEAIHFPDSTRAQNALFRDSGSIASIDSYRETRSLWPGNQDHSTKTRCGRTLLRVLMYLSLSACMPIRSARHPQSLLRRRSARLRPVRACRLSDDLQEVRLSLSLASGTLLSVLLSSPRLPATNPDYSLLNHLIPISRVHLPQWLLIDVWRVHPLHPLGT